MTDKPRSMSGEVNRELDKLDAQFSVTESNLKGLTLDKMNEAPRAETKEATPVPTRNPKDIYLKPKRTMSCKEPFNEKYRSEYEFRKEYVCFTALNNEIIGEAIELWTKKFAGVCAEEWCVPVGVPVWGPRYLAEQLKNCTYHKFSTQDMKVSSTHFVETTQHVVVDQLVNRLDAIPTSQSKSVFMGATF